MLVVVGSPAWRPTEPAGPAGRACEIALAAVARGARVEIVGRVGEDRPGDALVIALGHAGVGHAAVLRDPARPTALVAPPADGVPDEPDDPYAALFAGADDADAAHVDESRAGSRSGSGRSPVRSGASPVPGGPRLEPADTALALSYLTSFAVLVVADDAPPDVLPACLDAAAFAGARVVVLVPEAAPIPDGLPPDATALTAPSIADDGDFARLVGAYAAALDAGDEPAAAFRAATRAAGWEASEADEPA